MNLFTACVTPFSKQGSIDFASLERLLFSQEKAKNGVVLLGSTGESAALTLKERQEVISFVCSLDLDIPIVVGVPGHSLHEALSWMQFCHDFPLDGFLLTSPIYSKPGVKGQIAWFTRLLEESLFPAILYNIPSRAGTPLYQETVKELVGHPRLWGVKDSGGNLAESQKYAEDSRVTVFCGDDGLWPDMRNYGAQGLISVLSNAWPFAVKLLVEARQAESTLAIWKEATSLLGLATNPIVIKIILTHLRCLVSSQVRLPLSLEDFQEHDHRNVISVCEKMEREFAFFSPHIS